MSRPGTLTLERFFSHGYESKHTYPERPEPLEEKQVDMTMKEKVIYKEKVKMVTHREEECLYNKKISYGVLWKH